MENGKWKMENYAIKRVQREVKRKPHSFTLKTIALSRAENAGA